MTIRPTGLRSAVMSKKTRGRPIFSAAAAKFFTNDAKDGLLRRAVAPKWFEWLKVESIDSRQIDANAIFTFVITQKRLGLNFYKAIFRRATDRRSAPAVRARTDTCWFLPDTVIFFFSKFYCVTFRARLPFKFDEFHGGDYIVLAPSANQDAIERTT